MRMTRLDVVNEWKLIRKIQKWLYYLHMKPIATRRNVKSEFRIQPRNVIVRAQRLCQPNTRKCGIKEDLNQNDDRIISQKLEQYQRFLQILIINMYNIYICIHHTKRQNENMLSSYSILNLKTLLKFVSLCNLVPFLESGFCNVGNELDNCDFAVI